MPLQIKHLLCILACALILCSCSLFRKTEKTPPLPTQEEAFFEAPREDEHIAVRKPVFRRNPRKENTPEPVKEEVVVKPVERPVMKFSATESANVKIPLSLNNPFPTSGEMVIDLDEMAADFVYPLNGKLISPYGMRGRSMHTGIDIKTVPADTIRAAMAGVVRMAKPYSDYGNIVVIRHYNGLETVYSHNVKNLVSVNDVVEKGDPISLTGRTGRATTEHLHFEVRVASAAVNPSLFLDTDNHKLKSGKVYLYSRGSSVLASNTQRDNHVTTEEEPKTAVKVNAVPQQAQTTAQYHTIKSGDTLSQIARTYSTTVAKLCALNGIKATKVLQLKTKLRVK